MEEKVYFTPSQMNMPKVRRFKPKYLVYGLLAAILIEVLWGVKTLLAPVPVVKKASQPVPVKQATLSLSASKKDLKLGDSFLVYINLSSGGHRTAGTDIVLKYDSKMLSASSSGFTKGTLYPDYPAINIDNAKGVISVSGVSNPGGNGFDGNGLFGTVAFKARAVGRANIQLDFTKGQTNDSNVFELGTSEDILSRVNNLEVNIQ